MQYSVFRGDVAKARPSRADGPANQETEYLKSSRNNAQRIDEAIAALGRGEGTIRDLVQPHSNPYV